MKGPDRVMGALEKALDSKYQVLRWIGGGGMAQVYLARHRMTGGMFAVKVLSEYLAQDESIVERFIQEARTAAALSGHPNIVPIFDVGEQEDLHYLIMQYVDGEDLKTYLGRKGKLMPAEAARIIEQIADALSFAHARRVIHRDLKPSNIRMDRSGRAMVLDFGIAKAGETPTLLTATGQRVGTPQYMAPERFMGSECDQRSDLYSLGIVFYELVTGIRPFDGDTIGAIEVAQMSKAPRLAANVQSGHSRSIRENHPQAARERTREPASERAGVARGLTGCRGAGRSGGPARCCLQSCCRDHARARGLPCPAAPPFAAGLAGSGIGHSRSHRWAAPPFTSSGCPARLRQPPGARWPTRRPGSPRRPETWCW